MKRWHGRWCAGLALALSLPAVAADFNAWIPAGWKVVASAEGDLNGDGAADVVLVLQQQDARKIVANEGLGASQIDTNPRQIKVLLRQGQGYRLAAENSHWLPSAGNVESACLADPLLELGREPRHLHLPLAAKPPAPDWLGWCRIYAQYRRHDRAQHQLPDRAAKNRARRQYI